jgi:hypothetical protein
MESLELPPQIPESVASAFAVARNTWLYGWFYWPFYALAGFQAFRCMETAFRFRERLEEGEGRLMPNRKGPRSFRSLFRVAIDQKWIIDEGFQRFRDLDQRRREFENDLGGLAVVESPPAPRPSTEYSEVLAQAVPDLRNSHAHADAPIALLFDNTRLVLELARDVIVQVLGSVASSAHQDAGSSTGGPDGASSR